MTALITSLLEGRPTFKTWFAADKEWKDDTIVFEARPKEGARVPV